jgi:putative flippase GtrA
MTPENSNIAGYGVGLTVSYFLNKKYTFNSKQQHRKEIIRFLAVFILAYVLNYVALILLIHKFGVHEGYSQILAGLIYVIASYLMNKYFVFRTPQIS